ncbi:hypothetical protein AVEN_103766-1, partial [Araneus ventricosus]
MHVDAGKQVCIVLYYANIALGSLAKIQRQSFWITSLKREMLQHQLTWLMNNWSVKTLN